MDDPLQELGDLRAAAQERGLALFLLRQDEGESAGLEPLFLGTERQDEGMTALRILDSGGLRFEFVAYEEDVRRALDEPVDLEQPW